MKINRKIFLLYQMARKYKIYKNSSFYFVTFTVVDWLEIFNIQECRDIFVKSIEYCQKEKGLLVGSWCIMPNHIHMILAAEIDCNLSSIIRDLKRFTSSQIRKHLENDLKKNQKYLILPILKNTGGKNKRNIEFQLWQQHNHPIELVNNNMMESRLNYIHNNPVKAGFVTTTYSWLYSSAMDYAGEKGLIDIYFLD